MYVCPMHPEVQQDKPGRCPECGMNLVAIKDKKPTTHAIKQMKSGRDKRAADEILKVYRLAQRKR